MKIITSTLLILTFVCCITTLVNSLEAEPDFHSVVLQWDDHGSARERSVIVTVCEQSWRPNRCKDKSVLASRQGRQFSAQIEGLRMATKYTFSVRPLDTDRSLDPLPVTYVTAQTKGFAARATLCLANSTEVEVDTGSYFGGRISVEALGSAPGEIIPSSDSCSVWGDPQSTQSTYRLRFDHTLCGGTKFLNRSAIATYLLVQESLPILTHSTKRFLVVCTAQPDTLTVTAGISLPGGIQGSGAPESNVVGTGSVEPQRVARLLRNPSVKPLMLPTLHEPQTQELPNLDGSSGAQLVLMLALVSTVAVGSGFLAWWVIRRHKMETTEQVEVCSTNAVTLSRRSSISENSLTISTIEHFNRDSSESEASSVIRDNDSVCSVHINEHYSHTEA